MRGLIEKYGHCYGQQTILKVIRAFSFKKNEVKTRVLSCFGVMLFKHSHRVQ